MHYDVETVCELVLGCPLSGSQSLINSRPNFYTVFLVCGCTLHEKKFNPQPRYSIGWGLYFPWVIPTAQGDSWMATPYPQQNSPSYMLGPFIPH